MMKQRRINTYFFLPKQEKAAVCSVAVVAYGCGGGWVGQGHQTILIKENCLCFYNEEELTYQLNIHVQTGHHQESKGIQA